MFWVVFDCFLGEKWLVWVFWGRFYAGFGMVRFFLGRKWVVLSGFGW